MSNELLAAIVNQSIMSWEGRNPSPALDRNGNFVGTDLDLFSFLQPIAARGAVIEIPRYRNRRQIVVRHNERKVGTTNFGPLTGLTAKKDVFSFSVRIHDKSIIRKDELTGKEEIGAHRNYMVVDVDGYWYAGWDRIIWDPTAAENRFLTESRLWTGNSVMFKTYVHPNRWQSIFGAPYLLSKWAIARIDDEAGFYRSEVKRLKELGFVLPARKQYSVEAVGETVPIPVTTLEAELDIPPFGGNYWPVEMSHKGLMEAYKRQKFLTYRLKPFIQFGVRANEAAFYLYGFNSSGPRVAHWMEGRNWKEGYKTPNGRTVWNQMVLGPNVALRFRIRTLTQQVSAE